MAAQPEAATTGPATRPRAAPRHPPACAQQPAGYAAGGPGPPVRPSLHTPCPPALRATARHERTRGAGRSRAPRQEGGLDHCSGRAVAAPSTHASVRPAHVHFHFPGRLLAGAVRATPLGVGARRAGPDRRMQRASPPWAHSKARSSVQLPPAPSPQEAARPARLPGGRPRRSRQKGVCRGWSGRAPRSSLRLTSGERLNPERVKGSPVDGRRSAPRLFPFFSSATRKCRRPEGRTPGRAGTPTPLLAFSPRSRPRGLR